MESGVAKHRSVIEEEYFMQRVSRYIFTVVVLYVLLGMFASCGSDAGATEEYAGEITLGIGFRVPVRSTSADGYEEGDTYENYVDIENGNYRIYFFDTDSKFIARFTPSGFVVTTGSNYCDYSVLGKMPEALAGYSDFKLVVIANWQQYKDTDLQAGVTTIGDLCNADWAQFRYSKGFKPAPGGKLIPFYGVREYNNITFRSEQATILSDPVTLLRAMAKVEVTLETDDYFDLSFSSLQINRYNAMGYCAPKDVFTKGDYDHDGEWAKDYVQALHLVNDKNDEEEKTMDFNFVKRWTEEGKTYEQWMVYLPEYQNKGAGDAYSSIKAKLNIQLDGDVPHTIYFANYGDDGKTDNTDDENRLNIERNNIYRFHVKCTGYNLKLLLNVSDWEGLYENIFEYGDGQIVSPVSPWDDEILNEAEF